MSGDGTTWPMPSFSFAVAIDGVPLTGVSEVRGLGAQIEGGDVRPANILLRCGIFIGNLTLWRWFDAAAGQPAGTVTIDLLDEGGTSVRRWTLTGARPVKMTGPSLRSDANEIAVEEIEIACDRIAASIPDRVV